MGQLWPINLLSKFITGKAVNKRIKLQYKLCRIGWLELQQKHKFNRMGAPCFWNFGSLKFGRIGADPNILLGASTSINEKSRAAHIK